jgi:hypothetical protein
MTYLTAKDCNVFRASYASRFAAVDDVSHTFGVASYYKFYYEMEGWKAFIDLLFPDWFPVNTVQGLLMSVVDYLHDNRSEHAYNTGVDMGRAIVGKVTDTINWAQNQISNAVSDMRNRIDTEIVAPVREKAAQIEKSLNDALGRLNIAVIKVGSLGNAVDIMQSNIASFDGSIKAFDSKLGSFDSTLKGLDTTASGLQTQLRDAQAKLNEYKGYIDSLTTRVDKLEGKQFDLLREFEKFIRGEYA